jgi:hypothetical protein
MVKQIKSNAVTGGLTDDAPIDEVDEQLVAYLDGELDSEDRKQLETRLGHDAQLRARLRTLQDGWELLDELPTATPSAVLLESTLRMAAIEATGERSANNNDERFSVFPSRWMTPLALSIIVLSVLGFATGAVAVRVIDRISFENQLRQLPIALHVDAYLHGADLELMRSLREMPQWQQAVAISEQLGEWDFTLERNISQAAPGERQELLPGLSIEDQQEVTEAWNRFEQLSDQQRQGIIATASQVAVQSDADQLLTTMRRYARWRQSLSAPQRVAIDSPDPQQRTAVIIDALERTTRQWKQQTSRMLTDEDFEMMYQTLRQIARIRIDEWLEYDEAELSQQTLALLDTFATNHQANDPRIEAEILRRLFEDPPREPPPPMFLPPHIVEFRRLLEQIQGPLDDYELYMIESVLSAEVSKFLAAASSVESLAEELLRSWADEATRRVSSRRSGVTLTERYELMEPTRRDQLDLQPPDRMLESLREEGRRRRPTP